MPICFLQRNDAMVTYTFSKFSNQITKAGAIVVYSSIYQYFNILIVKGCCGTIISYIAL